VKLAVWRKEQKMTQAAMAAALGVSQPYISQIERAHNAMMPGKDVLVKIYELTGGKVEPNDFVDLPERSAA
jgi:transcriptional regulator with XRE-family HTH domain